MIQIPRHRYCGINVKPINVVSNLNMIYCNNGIGYFSPLRRHKIINTWSILTNEVSKLLWFNFLLHAVFTFEQRLIVLILYIKTSCVTFFRCLVIFRPLWDPLIQFGFLGSTSFFGWFWWKRCQNAQDYILLHISWSPKLPETSPFYSPPLIKVKKVTIVWFATHTDR